MSYPRDMNLTSFCSLSRELQNNIVTVIIIIKKKKKWKSIVFNV